MERGLACGVELFCIGVSASETHSQKNTGMTTTEALRRVILMAKKALAEGKKVQASVQSAFGCGFEGPIDRQKVLDIVKAYLDAGLSNISLADTAGHAHPGQVEDLYGAIRTLGSDVELACHFHNTYGLDWRCFALAMVSAISIRACRLGGCPFTKLPAECGTAICPLLATYGSRVISNLISCSMSPVR
jgi:hydroxymethylglutaryl-CoA lyase